MEDNKLFTIIIPTLDEEKKITGCLKSITGSYPCSAEVLIVDGGSKDKTLELARNVDTGIKTKIFRSEKTGLARQLDLGVKKAKGEYLVFLHVDCRLPANAFSSIKGFFKKYGQKAVGGAFKMKIEGSRFFYKVFSLGGDIYCNTTKTFFGDRAMFISKSYYEKIGGFRDIPIMADVDLSRRMKKAGVVKQLKDTVLSDGRKFEKESFIRMIYLQVWVLSAFKKGIDPELIRERYYYSQKKVK